MRRVREEAGNAHNDGGDVLSSKCLRREAERQSEVQSELVEHLVEGGRKRGLRDVDVRRGRERARGNTGWLGWSGEGEGDAEGGGGQGVSGGDATDDAMLAHNAGADMAWGVGLLRSGKSLPFPSLMPGGTNPKPPPLLFNILQFEWDDMGVEERRTKGKEEVEMHRHDALRLDIGELVVPVHPRTLVPRQVSPPKPSPDLIFPPLGGMLCDGPRLLSLSTPSTPEIVPPRPSRGPPQWPAFPRLLRVDLQRRKTNGSLPAAAVQPLGRRFFERGCCFCCARVHCPACVQCQSIYPEGL